MADLSTRYDGLEYYTLDDIRRVARHWLLRTAVRVVPRRLRRLLNPRRWPVQWRARFSLATDEELADLARATTDARERAKNRRELLKRKREYRRYIINALARAGAVYKWTEDGQRMARRIKFERVRISLDASAIYYQVNTRNLPDRVLISFLRHPDVVETVAGACKHQVEIHWDKDRPDEGFWYIVQLRLGVHGIPSEVEFNRGLELLEQHKQKKSLEIFIGVGVNGKAVFGDLADFPHVMVAGATGGGKSVWIKSTITTIALRNTPADVQFIFIDCKGGVELHEFEKLPHVLKFVFYKEEVPEILQMVLNEVHTRMHTFRDVGVVDWAGYNKRRFLSGRPLRKLTRWVVVIDELASLMLSNVKHKIEPLLTDILQLSRASGIHVIAATQRPSVDVITGLIKANIPVRIAFSTASEADSRTIIDTGDARGLTPKGRMIYLTGDQKLQLQGPKITPEMVIDKVNGIAGGETPQVLERSRRHNYTAADYFARALQFYGGDFKVLELWKDFKPLGVSRPDIEKVAHEYEGKEVEIDGHLYRLEPGKHAESGKRVARRLVPIVTNEEIAEPQQPVGPGGVAETDTPQISDFQPIQISDGSDLAEEPLSPSDEPVSTNTEAQSADESKTTSDGAIEDTDPLHTRDTQTHEALDDEPPAGDEPPTN